MRRERIYPNYFEKIIHEKGIINQIFLNFKTGVVGYG